MPEAPSRSLALKLVLAAFAVSLLWILANAPKPFHVDDPMFLYWARTISPLPGEKPVVYSNWEGFHEPFHKVQPWGWGLSALLVPARRLWGDTEVLHHLLQLPFAAMFLVGAPLLGMRFGARPWPVFALCATSPLFLMPAASLMSDLPCLGPGVLGFALWLGGNSLLRLLGAGFLLVLSGWMKPTVLPLLPLLFLEPDGGLVRGAGRWVAGAGTCLLAGWIPNLPPEGIVHGTFFGQVVSILGRSEERGGFQVPKMAYCLAVYASTALFPSGYAAAFMAGRPGRAPYSRLKAFAAAVLGIVFLSWAGFWAKVVFAKGNFPPLPADLNTLWFYASIAVFIAWGMVSGGRALRDRRRWLVLWLLLVFLGTAFGTWFPSARFSVFSLPALAILLMLDVRGLAARTARLVTVLAVAGNLWLGLSLAASDYAFASFCRNAAGQAARLCAPARTPLWTTGMWGLRWYVEKNGGAALGEEDEQLPRGAVLLAPEMTDHRELPAHLEGRVASRETWTAPPRGALASLALPWRALPPRKSAASYHGGHVWLPYAFASGPVETIEVLTIRPPGRKAPARRR